MEGPGRRSAVYVRTGSSSSTDSADTHSSASQKTYEELAEENAQLLRLARHLSKKQQQSRHGHHHHLSGKKRAGSGL